MPTLSVETLIAEILPLLHTDTAADCIFTSDAELTEEFQNGLKRLGQEYALFVQRDTTSIVFVSGTSIYSVPADYAAAMHVAYQGKLLIPSSTKELEALDDSWQTTEATAQNPVSRWYSDKIGLNNIGFYPTPAAADVGLSPEIIFLAYPCNLDDAHESTAINTPTVVGDLLELQVLAESYRKESDFQLPEVADACTQMA